MAVPIDRKIVEIAPELGAIETDPEVTHPAKREGRRTGRPIIIDHQAFDGRKNRSLLFLRERTAGLGQERRAPRLANSSR